MYYSYVEIEYVATSFSAARTDFALKLLRSMELKHAPFPESTVLRRSLRSSKDAVLVPILPG
jgi:hypothetical protein